MANPQIKLKRSSTQNKRPTPTNVPLGELAINTYDGYLYASKDVGVGTTVITVNPWRVGTGTDSYNIDFTAGNVGINSASPTALLDVNGDVNISGVVTATSFVKESNSSGFLKADGTEDTNTYLTSYTETQTLNDVLGLGNISGIGLSVGVVTATSFVKSDGTSSQFLKADGSVDSSTYLTSFTETDPVVAGINGIVKSDGTTISAATAGTDYLTDISQDTNPQLGGNLVLNSNDITGTGNLNITGIATFSGNVTIGGTLTYDDVTNIDSIGLVTARSGIEFGVSGVGGTITSTGNVTFAGIVTASSFVKSGGTSSEFLKADGSVDSSTYLTSFTETNDLSSAVTWANVPDANITESSVTQHQAALSITESQISDLQSYLTSYTETQTLDDVLGLGNISGIGLSVGVVTATSFVKSSNSGGFLKADGTEDTNTYLTSFTETNDLSSAVTWANVPDANITESSVTQHQAALSITESQISDLQSYLTSYTETQTLNDVLGLGNVSGIGLSVGVVTATSFDGNLTGNVNSTGVSTFTTNVSIGTTIEIIPYNDLGALSFEGSAGQLFSITNNLTSGSIFSVNDISGLPSIDVDADGTIQLAPNSSTEYVGIGTTAPTVKLDVNGDVNISGAVTATSFTGDGSNLTGIVTGIQAGSNITILESPAGNFIVTSTASGGGDTGTATTITLADESTDTECFLIFATDATGDQEPKTGSNLTFNSSTGALTATSFVKESNSSGFLKADGTEDTNTYLTSFTETNDLSSAVTWANVPDANITESSVTQHQAALSITESQISDLQSYLTSYTETQTLDDVLGLGNTSDTGLSVGVVTATSFDGNLTGISSYASEWNITANGSSDYKFTGPGFDGTELDPTIYLVRGRRYKFTNNMGAHPFEIRTAIDGSAYSDGITNNAVSNGTLTWDVQMDAPNILYYQCTAHAAMVGTIYIGNSGSSIDVTTLRVGTGITAEAGIITAASFVKRDGTSSQFLKADGSVDSSTYLTSYTETDPVVAAINGIVKSDGSTISAASAGTDYLDPTGDGSGLSGIVTNIQAGTNITVLESPAGNFIVTSTAAGGGDTVTINATATDILSVSSGDISADDAGADKLVFWDDSESKLTYLTAGNGLSIDGTTITATGSGGISGIEIENSGTSVGTGITAINFNTNLTATASGGIATITASGGSVGAATTITLADESTDTICYPIFATDPTGDQEPKTDASNLLYNSNTGALSAGSFFGDGSTLTNVLSNVSEDTTPQLGGPLDINSNDINGTGNIDITGNLDVSGIASVGSAITMYGSTGIVSATEYYGDGSNLSSIVTQLTAGTGIVLNQTTGNVTITASGGGDADPTTRTTTRFVATASQSSFTVSYSVGYVDAFLNGSKLDSTEYTATNGTSVSLTTAAAADDIVEIVAYESVGIVSITSATQGLDVTGHLETDTFNSSGIVTAASGIDAIGIQSGGVNIADGVITALNFIGAGNTFALNGTVVDISIAGGGGGGISSIADDTAPQLGGDLDLNDQDITGTGNLNITGVVTATSFVKSSNSGGFLKADGAEDTNTYLTSYTETNDLSSAVTWANVPDANITESSVTQHQAALSITESQISDLQSYLTSYTETQTLDDVLGLGNISGIGLSVGVVTATSFVKSGGTSSQFLKADGSVDSSTYLTSYTETQTLDDVLGLGNISGIGLSVGVVTATSFSGDGSNLTGIVTNIQAGANITVLESPTGNFIVTSTASGGGGSSGIEIENSGTSVGTAITSINFSTNLTATASGGIATITASGGGGGGNPVSKSSTETTATGGQTVFNGTYTVGFVDVFLNGSKLDSSEFTATNGTSITLTTGATANDIIEVIGFTFADGSTNIELSNDSSPELGANLDLKGFNIVDSVGGGIINATVAGQIDALEIMLFT